MSRTSVLLPLPLTPVTDDQAAERDLDVDVAQVVLASALDRRATRPTASGAVFGTGIVRLPARYWPVIESLTFRMPLTGPL